MSVTALPDSVVAPIPNAPPAVMPSAFLALTFVACSVAAPVVAAAAKAPVEVTPPPFSTKLVAPVSVRALPDIVVGKIS